MQLAYKERARDRAKFKVARGNWIGGMFFDHMMKFSRVDKPLSLVVNILQLV